MPPRASTPGRGRSLACRPRFHGVQIVLLLVVVRFQRQIRSRGRVHSLRKFVWNFDARRLHGSVQTSTTKALQGGSAVNDANGGPRRHLLSVMIERSNTSSLKTMFHFLQSHTPREHFDEAIYNHTVEYERCQRYGLTYSPMALPGKGKPARRRRIFFGSLIADDTWHSIGAHAAEVYGLYHTAVFIESNLTQMLTPREMRFEAGSLNHELLVSSGIFGAKTRVSVDSFDNRDWNLRELIRENVQRSLILKTWRRNGMTKDDIGIVSDVDEFFTRDFLLAAMTCDVPEFRPGQNCHKPKVVATSLVLESTPECITDRRYWFHPDMISGECIETIGNATDREPAPREYGNGKLGRRMEGKGQFLKDWEKLPKRTRYPLWTPADFRSAEGGIQYGEANAAKPGEIFHTAFHLHNYFSDLAELRHKYKTYGHPVLGADSKALGRLHDDVNGAVMCAMNRTSTNAKTLFVHGGWEAYLNQGRRIPLLHANEKYRQSHLDELRTSIAEDESKYGEASYGGRKNNYTFGKAYFGRKKYRLPRAPRKKMNSTNVTRIYFDMLARQKSTAN